MTRPRLFALLAAAGCAALLLHVSCGGGGGDSSNRVLANADLDWRDQVIYQLLTDRFADGDVNNNWNVDRTALGKYQGGDFQGIIDHLDYLQALGVTAIWISPVVKNVEDDAGVSGYHGYWAQDLTATNPHFGTLSDLRRMVNACHDRGIYVICDVVTNHIGQLFYYDINQNGVPDVTMYGSNVTFTYPDPLMRILEYDPPWQHFGVQTAVGSPYNQQGWAPIRWLRDIPTNHMPIEPPEFLNPAWYHRFGRVVPEDNGNWPFVEVQLGDFPGGDKDLATERPDVRQALIRVFADWIRKVDFDGFRIDTLKHVERAIDINPPAAPAGGWHMEVGDWQNFLYDSQNNLRRNMYQYEDGYRHPQAPPGRTYPANYPGFWELFCPAMRQAALAKGKHRFLMFGECYDGNDALCGSFTKKGLADADPTGVYTGADGLGMLDSVFNFPEKYKIDGVIGYGAATKELEVLLNNRDSQSNSSDPVRKRFEYYGTEPHPEGVGVAPLRLPINFIDNHDVTRFINHCGPDDAKALKRVELALAYIFAREGVPCIYYGTEQVFRGQGPTGQQQLVFAGRGDPTNREVLWETGFDTTKPMFQWIRRLSDVRRQYVSLRRGGQFIRWSTTRTGDNDSDAGIFAFERAEGAERVLFVMNAKDKTSYTRDPSGQYRMDTDFATGTVLVDVLDPNYLVDPALAYTYTVGTNGDAGDIAVPPLTARLLVPRQ